MTSESKAPEAKKGKRMTPKDWAEAIALWEYGEVTLEELSEKYGLAKETFSRRFTKEGAVKGRLADEHEEKVREKISKKMVADTVTTIERQKMAKEDFYNNSIALSKLSMHEIVNAKKAKIPLGGTLAALKAIEKAAQIQKICKDNIWMILGLDKDEDVDLDDLPDLPITEMSAREIEEMHQRQINDALGLGDEGIDLEGEEKDVVEES